MGSVDGQCDDEGGTLSKRAFRGNCSSVAIHDLFADGQADAGSRIFVLAMEALKGLKDLV